MTSNHIHDLPQELQNLITFKEIEALKKENEALKKENEKLKVTELAMAKEEDTEDDEVEERRLEELFWEELPEYFGSDIIGSKTHPLKHAFKIYKQMKGEEIGGTDDEEEEEEEDDN